MGGAQLGSNLLTPDLVKCQRLEKFLFRSHLVGLRVNSGDQDCAKVGLIRSLANLGEEFSLSERGMIEEETYSDKAGGIGKLEAFVHMGNKVTRTWIQCFQWLQPIPR